MAPKARQSFTPMNGSQRECGCDAWWAPALAASAGPLTDDGLAGSFGESAPHGEPLLPRRVVRHAVGVVLEIHDVAEVLVDHLRAARFFDPCELLAAEPTEDLINRAIGCVQSVVPFSQSLLSRICVPFDDAQDLSQSLIQVPAVDGFFPAVDLFLLQPSDDRVPQLVSRV